VGPVQAVAVGPVEAVVPTRRVSTTEPPKHRLVSANHVTRTGWHAMSAWRRDKIASVSAEDGDATLQITASLVVSRRQQPRIDETAEHLLEAVVAFGGRKLTSQGAMGGVLGALAGCVRRSSAGARSAAAWRSVRGRCASAPWTRYQRHDRHAHRSGCEAGRGGRGGAGHRRRRSAKRRVRWAASRPLRSTSTARVC